MDNIIERHCHECQVPTCNGGLFVGHTATQHRCERIQDAESRQIKELDSLSNEGRAAVEYCNQNSSQPKSVLQASISDYLQIYKVVLENYRDNALDNLEGFICETVLGIMDSFEIVEEAVEAIGRACHAANRLLEHGDAAAEISPLCQLVVQRVTELLENIPKPNLASAMDCQTDSSTFQGSIEERFDRMDNCSQGPASQRTSHALANWPSSSHPTSLFATIQSYLVVETCPVVPPASANNQPLPPPPPGFVSTGSRGKRLDVTGEQGVYLCTGRPQSQRHVMDNLQARQVHENGSQSRDFNSTMTIGSNLVSRRGSWPVYAPNQSTQRSNTLFDNGYRYLPSPLPAVHPGPINYDARGYSLQNLTVNNAGHVFCQTSRCTLNSGYRNLPNPMQMISKFCNLGAGEGQLNTPRGFCLGTDGDTIVADTNNHRIQVFKANGSFKLQFGKRGREPGHLWKPRKVTLMRRCGNLVVCDSGENFARLQIFEQNGAFVKVVWMSDLRLVSGLQVNDDDHIVVVDSVLGILRLVSDGGLIVRQFSIAGHVFEPGEVATRGHEYYICDGHCVCVFDVHGNFLRRVGCAHSTPFPSGVDISHEGVLHIGDSDCNTFHVAVCSADGSRISEYLFPAYKAVRCRGLKITSKGHIVTVVMQNNCIIVMKTVRAL